MFHPLLGIESGVRIGGNGLSRVELARSNPLPLRIGKEIARGELELAGRFPLRDVGFRIMIDDTTRYRLAPWVRGGAYFLLADDGVCPIGTPKNGSGGFWRARIAFALALVFALVIIVPIAVLMMVVIVVHAVTVADTTTFAINTLDAAVAVLNMASACMTRVITIAITAIAPMQVVSATTIFIPYSATIATMRMRMTGVTAMTTVVAAVTWAMRMITIKITIAFITVLVVAVTTVTAVSATSAVVTFHAAAAAIAIAAAVTISTITTFVTTFADMAINAAATVALDTAAIAVTATYIITLIAVTDAAAVVISIARTAAVVTMIIAVTITMAVSMAVTTTTTAMTLVTVITRIPFVVSMVAANLVLAV